MMKIDHAIADGVGLLDVLFNLIDNKDTSDSPKKLPGVEGLKSEAVGTYSNYSRYVDCRL